MLLSRRRFAQGAIAAPLAGLAWPARARTPQVVMLCPGFASEPFWQDAVACTQACAAQLGLQLSVLHADRDHLQMIRYAELLAQASPAPDLVLVPNEKLSALGVLRALSLGRVPSLLFHNRLTTEQARQLAEDAALQRHCLGSTHIDQFDAGQLTASYLLQQSRLPERPSWWLMSGDRATPASVDRVDGVRMAWRQMGHQPGREHLLFGQWSRDVARQQAEELLARQAPPDVLWCGSDLMSTGALQALAKARPGGRLPAVASVNHGTELLQQLRDGRVCCTATGHFISAAWALGLWAQHRREKIQLQASKTWRGKAFVLIHAGNVQDAAAKLKPASVASLDFCRLPTPGSDGEVDLRPMLRWNLRS